MLMSVTRGTSSCVQGGRLAEAVVDACSCLVVSSITPCRKQHVLSIRFAQHPGRQACEGRPSDVAQSLVRRNRRWHPRPLSLT